MKYVIVAKRGPYFAFCVLQGKDLADLEKLESIRTLVPAYAHRNLTLMIWRYMNYMEYAAFLD